MPEVVRHRFREAYQGPMTVLPEMPHVGWTFFPKAAVTGLAPHTHPGAYEICYVVGGRVEWWVGKETHSVGRGSGYLTHPD